MHPSFYLLRHGCLIWLYCSLLSVILAIAMLVYLLPWLTWYADMFRCLVDAQTRVVRIASKARTPDGIYHSTFQCFDLCPSAWIITGRAGGLVSRPYDLLSFFVKKEFIQYLCFRRNCSCKWTTDKGPQRGMIWKSITSRTTSLTCCIRLFSLPGLS